MNCYCSRCEKETWHDKGNCISCFKNHHNEDERKRIQNHYKFEDFIKNDISSKK